MDIQQISELIKKRRSIFPETYTDQPIPKEVIEQILENANWAPTHKKTEPWRFKVFQGKALERLSGYLGDWYVANTPEAKFSEKKLEKTKKKPLRSACVIALCMQRDPEERLPEWEEVAALACAVQNMWLSCTALNIGCYWSSPRSILEADEFLQLGEGEKCYGLFYMGYHQMPDIAGKRSPYETKVSWFSE
ncbi:MAG: nitroreductase [Saprospiraceae bacterium]|nr:nitroreductase [Saprospiraceae bacterium]